MRQTTLKMNLLALAFGLILVVCFDWLLGFVGVASLADRGGMAGFSLKDRLYLPELEKASGVTTYGRNPARENYFNS